MIPESKSIFLFGATSILGWNLVRLDRGRSLSPFCNTHTNYPATRGWPRLSPLDENTPGAHFIECAPALLIYCDGICDVEKCEKDPAWAREVNVSGLARVLKVLPVTTRLVYCSSDHVFSGDGSGYDESATPDPISVYGRTRVEAERMILSDRRAALILRVSLGIGPSINGRSGHLDWLRYRTARKLPITLVEDEFRSAVWMEDLVARVMRLVRSEVCGIRHITATRAVSRPELAEYLNQKFGIGARFNLETRNQRRYPHIGRVELQTRFRDELATPLPSVVD